MSEVRRLPRGRHRLTRDEVLASQRGRMLAAMAEAVAEKGFARTTVKDVLTRAGVSRETFYEHFADKDACFLAAYELSVELLQGAMRSAWEGERGGPLARLERSTRAYLQALAREPDLARVFFIEIFAAGPAAVERRFAVLDAFVDLVAAMVGEDDRTGCTAFVSAVSTMVAQRIGTGRAAELPGLTGEVMEIAQRLLPALAGARRTA